MIRNHTTITGPNSLPTAAVPWRCTANRTVMITAVIGMTNSARLGLTTLSPSTAESTEIAGVIMLSPKNNAAPRIPSIDNIVMSRALERPPIRWIRVIKAITPPSPSLSARMTKVTYVSVTMVITDQKINDTTP